MIAVSGPLAFSDINVELRRAWNNPLSLNDPHVRRMAGISAGPIHLGHLRGKSHEFVVTIGSSDWNYNAAKFGAAITAVIGNRLQDTAADTIIRIKVNAGVQLVSDSTATPCLLFGSLPGMPRTENTQFILESYGTILGRGGAGGGGNGGPAIRRTNCAALSIFNYGTIAPGGGGGANASGQNCWQEYYSDPTPPSGCCVHPDTPIATPEGWTPIKDLRPGDTVLGMEMATRTIRPVTIQGVVASLRDKRYRVQSGAHALEISNDHPMALEAGGWAAISVQAAMLFYGQYKLELRPLEVGQALIGLDGPRPLERITPIHEVMTLLTLDVTDGVDTFFAAGFLVHNKRND